MNKYFAIFKTSFKQETKTLVNALVQVSAFIVIIFIFKQLWNYIYSESGIGNLINGYTIEMMIWYMIMGEVYTYASVRRAITKSFGNDIKSGKIAYQLNKPYNYFIYQISNQTAVTFWRFLFLIPSGILIGLLLLGPIANFQFYFIFPILFSLLISVFLSCLIYSAFGMLCFWIEEATPFTWIFEKFMLLFGVFFPPEFFPTWLQPIIVYSPIYALISGPSKLLSNFSWELFFQVSLTQLCYIILSILLCVLMFKRGIKKINVYGG